MATPTLPHQASYLLLVLDGDVDPRLPEAWQDARASWNDRAAHDRLLALARQHDGYTWLAARYRKLAARGDEIAQQRLALIGRVVELTMLFRPVVAEEQPRYRSLSRMVIMLAALFALGFLLLTHATRTHAAPQPEAARPGQRGSAILVVMLLITALMAGTATLVSLQTSSNRATQVTSFARSALHCAEAGLAAARAPVAANYKNWNAALAAGTEPAWLGSIQKDLDGDGAADYTVVLVDNEDEVGIGSNDPAKDNDLVVYIVSTCTKYAETPVQVSELVRYNGGNNCYQAQLGGCGGNNNAN